MIPFVVDTIIIKQMHKECIIFIKLQQRNEASTVSVPWKIQVTYVNTATQTCQGYLALLAICLSDKHLISKKWRFSKLIQSFIFFSIWCKSIDQQSMTIHNSSITNGIYVILQIQDQCIPQKRKTGLGSVWSNFGPSWLIMRHLV